MSYILDALRKADADRERGAAAELLGTPEAASVDVPPSSTRRQPVPVWHWLVAGAAIPLVALLVWRWATPDEPAPVIAAVTAAAASAAVATPVAPRPASVPASATMVAAAGTGGSEARETAPATSASTPRVAPAPPLPPKPAASKPAAPKPAARKTPPKPPVVAAPPPARAEAKPGLDSTPVRAFADLPEDLRRQVPAMTIGGSVYSPQPASRMLIVNGQVMREGATLAPGLQLESIGRQSAVFSIQGQRFEMKL